MPHRATIAVAGALSILAAVTSASGGLSHATVRTVGTGLGPERNWTQYEIVATFDGPDDHVTSVSGILGSEPLSFRTTDCEGLVNTANVLGPTGADLWNPWAPGDVDSWLTIGFDQNVQTSPMFFESFGGDSGGHVAGTNWSVEDGGYLVAGGGVLVGAGEIVIANFVVRDTRRVELSGMIGWLGGGGAGGTVPFIATNMPIASPIAPCCLPDGGCAAIFECACLELGGTWNGGLGVKVFCDDLPDCNGNGVPDACDAPPGCPGDLDASGTTGFADLNTLLTDWGPCTCCATDLDGDGQVGSADLDALLAAWGPCPP